MHEIHDFLHQVNADVPVVLIYASAGTVQWQLHSMTVHESQ